MPKTYVDIAFPTAVRRLFTYHISEDQTLKPGMRVWVPLRNEYAIGMAVQVHERRPDFKTKPVEQVLDDEPIMNDTMLKLTEWIHRFYYCSWGEAIQAALPVGLNFSSVKKLRVKKSNRGQLTKKETELLEDIEAGDYSLRDARKRWRDGVEKKLLNKAIKSGWVEVWEEPRQRVDYKTAKHWKIPESIQPQEILDNLTEKDQSKKWVSAFEKLT
ncbi:MAG: primosomal protein N', partial [Bacteroidetes bacterium]|nr:primosomal protein N' [Bacteroidota bacterium]